MLKENERIDDLEFKDLKNMGVVMKRAKYFITCNGKYFINKDLFNLVKDATEILSDDPLFFIINTYTTGLSKTVLEDILNLTVNKKYKGKVESYEIGLLGKNNLVLPCGETGKWEKI